MKNISLVILLTLLTFNLFAQSDEQALKILDKFSANAQSAPSVSMKFHMISVNQMEKINDTVPGSIILSKDQYKIELPDNITWFNGTTSWNYLKAEKEVTITKPDKKDDSFLGKPSAIFSIYKKGYKTRFVEERPNTFLVDLYPEDFKSELIRIRIEIGKSKSDLVSTEYKRKDGLTVYLVVNEYNLNTKPDPSTFIFNPNNYKGVEVIDMR